MNDVVRWWSGVAVPLFMSVLQAHGTHSGVIASVFKWVSNNHILFPQLMLLLLIGGIISVPRPLLLSL